jgi:hypothetical protein
MFEMKTPQAASKEPIKLTPVVRPVSDTQSGNLNLLKKDQKLKDSKLKEPKEKKEPKDQKDQRSKSGACGSKCDGFPESSTKPPKQKR